MKYDSVVIGSGLSGLTAALILRKNGRKAALLEKDGKPGPLLRRFKRGGVWCDTGFHYTGGFLGASPLKVISRYLGIWDNIHPMPMNPHAFDRITIDEKTFEIPVGLENAKRAYLDYFPGSTHAVEMYFSYIEEILKTTPYASFEMELDDLSNEYKTDESLEDFLNKHGAEEDFIFLTGTHSYALCGMDIHEIPMYFHALIMGSFYEGAYTFDSGGDEVINALVDAFKKNGGSIYCSHPVEKIELDDKKTLKAVVCNNGTRFECNECIFTAHPQLLADMLPRGIVRPVFFNRLKDLRNTKPIFVVWLDAKKIPEKLRHTNNYMFKKDAGVTSLFAAMACNGNGMNKKALCLIRTVNDPEPTAMEYAQKDLTPAYHQFKGVQTEKTLRHFEQMFPEMKGEYELVDSATSHTFKRYTGTPGGSAYGAKHVVGQRDLTPTTSIRGLYLAGQSIHFPGLMGTIISAFLTTSVIFGVENIWNQVKKYQ